MGRVQGQGRIETPELVERISATRDQTAWICYQWNTTDTSGPFRLSDESGRPSPRS